MTWPMNNQWIMFEQTKCNVFNVTLRFVCCRRPSQINTAVENVHKCKPPSIDTNYTRARERRRENVDTASFAFEK